MTYDSKKWEAFKKTCTPVPGPGQPVSLEYSSNNSGGSWWLKDEDWIALEKAGWKVEWYADAKEGTLVKKMLDNKKKKDKRPRWLGALASKAYKVFPSVSEGLAEWERITGQTCSDEGCNCCGAPHSFNWGAPGCHEESAINADGYCTFDTNYASGEDLLNYRFEKKPRFTTLRELYEAENE